MVCDRRWLMLGAMSVAAATGTARAQSPGDAMPTRQEQSKQFDDLLKQAQQMGPWDRQSQLNEEAVGLVFQRQGWSSEPDQFALGMLREVDRVPPWQMQQRQDVFLRSMQSRYNLTEAQKTLLNGKLQYEGMRLTFKYFKDATPIAMEAMKARADGKPFTPEQVARWSRTMQPMLDDGRQSIERVAGTLSETMTPEQRRLMDTDLKAFQKRHEDVVKMVGKWEQGQWDPRDWGLDHDPAHAALVASKQAEQAQMAALQQMPGLERAARPDDESSWERYVREFGAARGFDAVQTKSARAILKEQVSRAKNFRAAHSAQLATLQRDLAAASDPAKKAEIQKDMDGELAPIGDLFKELCNRLEELLTAEQRERAGPRAPAAAGARAGSG